ncbi:MAG: putative DNA-binding domain-containing protein [Methylococcales bacterium]|nr:putative DNA-binding domain-containing protein [Methylococcales bacterium]MDP3840326.1 putative DNA-binding domain-containing protein [Methylococcales bacterium]
MMAFQAVQRQFLAFMRNPVQAVPVGFAPQGVAIYVDLLYNKFNESLELCFPVTQQLLGVTAWQLLVKAFIAQHSCLSPYYRQIPDEFIAYLQAEPLNDDAPLYLLELAHFEWIELALAIADTEPVTAFDSVVNDWLNCRPVFAPVLQLLHYAYPVQRINQAYQPTTPPEQTTAILGFRDRDDVVQFIELNPPTARLVDILQTGDYTVQTAIQQIASELQHPEPSVLFSFGVATVTDLMQQGAILGAVHEDST